MKIVTIEKVILTEEEMNALDDACTILEKLYSMAPSGSELDNQLSELLTPLSDFIDDVEVIIENN